MGTPLFLVGFMGAGKTTVGRLVAERLGRRFIDLDDEIAAAAGVPVPVLVARDEPAFRRIEADTLIRVIAGAVDGAVVATGGGAAAFGDNIERMRASGLVVALNVSVATVRVRCGEVSEPPLRTPVPAAEPGTILPSRPLLHRSDRDVEALLHRREGHYRRAHAVVDTDGAGADAVAARVLAAYAAHQHLGPELARTSVIAVPGERAYPIAVSRHGLDGALIRDSLPPRTRLVAVISDGNVAAAWGEPLRAALVAAGFGVHVETIPPGEASKSMATYQHVCEALVAARLDRSSAIVALGGGVVGDLAGFVASTLFRGIPVVQVPTTLVAMTDSAIGGKTGIDLPAGKNLVGAFWQPRLVAAHLPVLATLPARERRAAFGELWKYALLDGTATWDAVEALVPWAQAGEGAQVPTAVADVVERCARYKAWIVARDERETRGERALLNLGHTLGHAIEAEAEWRLLHGECIALGLVAACRVSAALGLGAAELEGQVVDAVRRVGLDADLDPWLTPAVLARIGVDKKRAGSRIGFVTVREIGACEVVPVEAEELSKILRARTPL